MGRLFLTLILVITSSLCHAEIIERIEAVVNERAITMSDLEEEIAVRRQLGEVTERGIVLDSLVEAELVTKEAGRLGLMVSTEEIASEILRLEGTFPSSDGFKNFLDEYGLSLKDISRKFASSISIEKVRRQKEGASPGRYEKWLSEVRKKADIKIMGNRREGMEEKP